MTFDLCRLTPTNTVTAVNADRGGAGCNATFPNATSYTPTSFNATGGPGGTPLWTWAGATDSSPLTVYISGSSVFARVINVTLTAASAFGAVGGPNGGYKDVTDDLACNADGNLAGTIVLVNALDFCDAGDAGTHTITLSFGDIVDTPGEDVASSQVAFAGNGYSEAVVWRGGTGSLFAQGDFDGATLAVQFTLDMVNWTTTSVSLTASGNAFVDLGPCFVRLLLSGGSSPAVAARLVRNHPTQ